MRSLLFFMRVVSMQIDHVSPALREVAEFLAGQTLSVDVETVSFTQHFPRQGSLCFTHSIFINLSYFLTGKRFLEMTSHGR